MAKVMRAAASFKCPAEVTRGQASDNDLSSQHAADGHVSCTQISWWPPRTTRRTRGAYCLFKKRD